MADTLRHTGGALVGSAVTTGLAFGVLGLSSSVPLRQFGTVAALMIGYALVACLVLQPTLLAIWARRRADGAEGTGTQSSAAAQVSQSSMSPAARPVSNQRAR